MTTAITARPAFLNGGGEMAELIAHLDWSRTAIGPIDRWPGHIRHTVAMMLQSAVPMVALFDAPGVMIYNDAYSVFAGGRHPRLLGSPVREGWPEVADFNDNVMKVGLAGGTLSYHDQELTLHRTGRPEQVWMNLDYSPVLDNDGRPAAVLAIVVETTSKVRLEQRLASERERMHQMFEQAPGFMCVLSGPDQVFAFANAAYRQLFGRELLGRAAREAFAELEGQGFFERLDEVFNTGVAYRAEAMPALLTYPDGRQEQKYLTFVYQPVFDEAGRVTDVFCEGTDATVLMNAYETLQRDMTERVRTEEQLRETNRRKDEFLAMLAHELRNPLAPIATGSALLQRASDNADIVRRTSDLIARQVRHMSELVDDLLDVSRVTRGLIEIERAPLDLRSVVQSAMEQARPLVESRRHTVSVSLPREEMTVEGDRTRLVQVLVNLLTNAAKYTPAEGHIDLSLTREDGTARVVVQDDGTGIEPALLPLIFDLFIQGERTPDRSQGGLGIGLALVKAIVLLHHGAVGAHSEGKGRGSRFTIELPLVDGGQGDEPAGAPAHEALPALRVLLTDDNQDAADALAALLRLDGHEVRVCYSGEQALAETEAFVPDVAVLDVGLPGITGLELARRLRARDAMRGTLFVALTGYGQAHDREATARAGFDHHLVKPVEPQALDALLAQAKRH